MSLQTTTDEYVCIECNMEFEVEFYADSDGPDGACCFWTPYHETCEDCRSKQPRQLKPGLRKLSDILRDEMGKHKAK